MPTCREPDTRFGQRRPTEDNEETTARPEQQTPARRQRYRSFRDAVERVPTGGVWRNAICAMLLVAAGTTVFGQPAKPPSEAREQFAKWVAEVGSRGEQTGQDIERVVVLARARAEEMRALMEKDPAEFIQQALPEEQRAQLPAQIQAQLEKRVKGRGFFGTCCVFPTKEAIEFGAAHPAGLGYEVRVNGVAYQGFAFGKWKDAGTVYEADIEGVALGDAIALGDSPTPSEQVASGQTVSAYTPTTTGPNTLLYIIARFSDQTSYPIDDATALSQMGVVSNFWLNNSSGTVSIRGLANSGQVMDIVHVTLPQPSSYASTYNASSLSLLLSDSRTAAQAAGFNYANYNLDVTVTTSGGFSYAGRGFVGAQGCHLVTGYTSLRTAGHELGHNLGLWHANYWRTDSPSPFGKDSVPGGYVADTVNSEWVEYGHYFSLMSAQYGGEIDDPTKPHYAPVEKARLGWLSGSELQYITASGTYRLFRVDERNTVGNPRGIRIETAATDYTGYARRYWLVYRYAPWNTGQSWLRNGLQVDVAQTSYGSDGAIQLDMTPYSKDEPSGASWYNDNSDKVDGALVIGRTYDDLNAGIHITPVATGSNGTGEEYIDVVVNLGSFSGNRAPIITSFGVTTNQAAVGQPVNFSVAATDPDGDALAYAWDFGDGQVWTASGLNTNAAAKSWPTAGQYRVLLKVSDMKGGLATASQIVTVGTPANTNQIWGRVVWAGTPVGGARISTSNGGTVYQAWSESDGSYVLPGLPAGSFTLNCQAAGLTFTPQFQNPVALTNCAFYGADFYANEQLPGGGGTRFTLSGQVKDPVNAVAGVEVRAGGMATVTDSSGNYQFTNLVSGTYTATARKDGWTFSPASLSVTISSANSTGNNFARVAPYSISGSFSGVNAGNQDPAPTVYLSNGRSVACTRGGSGGNRYWVYTLNNVPAGSYGVSAYLSGYRIVPSGFANPLTISGNASGINFSGTAASLAGAISGRVTQYGLPLAGVSVQVSQGGSTAATVVSDSDGYYRADDLASGAYSLLPSKSGYSFSPGSLNVGSVPSSGNNFSAYGPSGPPQISSVGANPPVVSGPGGTTLLTAAATGSGSLVYSWDATNAAGPVTFSVNDASTAASTRVGFQVPGSYVFRVRVTDGNGLMAFSKVNVTVSAGAGSMVVAPYEVQMQSGQALGFRADAWDQLGNRITVSPSWFVDGGGSIDNTGVFTASMAGGPFQVVATASGLSATGFVWVGAAQAPMPPTITTQPANRTIVAGSSATFNVVSAGTAPLGYQWLFNASPISGATASSYTRTNVQPSDAGPYSVQVTNIAGIALSSNALLTVLERPIITGQPSSRTVVAGSNTTFSVAATGTSPLSYQWLANGAPVPGATASTFTRTNTQPTDAGTYSVQVTNIAGIAVSSNAVLAVIEPPVILTEPQSQAVAAGSNVTFTVVAAGTAPLSYFWLFNGVRLSGGTASIYTVTNAQTANAGRYTVVVSNAAASVESKAAVLTINNAPVLAAISNRTIHAGSTVVVTNTATDTDVPPQSLTFSIEQGPPNSAIDATNGVFLWTSTLEQANTSQLVVIRVTDDGTPPLSGTQSFAVNVLRALKVESILETGGRVTLTWNAIPGKRYQVQFKTDIAAAWSPLGQEVMAEGISASATDSVSDGAKIYRVMLME